MIIRTLLAAASIAVAVNAIAQAPAGKPAAHTCQNPGEHPGKLGSDTNRRKWTTDANAYLECLKKYVGEQTSSYNSIMQQAKPFADAANSATTEYNNAVKSLKETADKNN
ncbi:MAG TPA: hypothetical protein VNG69_16260 [Casimicrobiaceae bacterium]|nr:hypothetical protein [Casimicrobiaceae bacterium]